ncbi:hypothetical protein L210DRAFT_1052584 [Boletus edulis BED1]|uniref:Uncharacterized protein n=1 Tax=Boletus edulis BED1 TaxID=1328754 RepID=A0AAD4BLM3_BOLED|nr:hypothetical protein L210DRAFT_1052584 [Boletus edulis BED1]
MRDLEFRRSSSQQPTLVSLASGGETYASYLSLLSSLVVSPGKSIMASPPERTTLPPSSSSKFSKLFKFFTSKHNDTGSGIATNSGGQGAGATSGGISSTGVADSNCGDSDENDDDDEISEHPSNVINQYLLQQFPEAEAAIVHDDVWMNLRFDGPMRKDKLIRSVFAKFEPTYDPINGVVSLVPKSL